MADQNFRVKNGLNVGTAVTITTSECQVGATRIHSSGIEARSVTVTDQAGISTIPALKLTGALYDTYNNVGAGNSVLISTGIGVSWIDIPTAALQGVQGTQGTQGVQGVQGTQGSQGVQGIQGVQGTFGTQGIQGIIGAQGFNGTLGSQGTQGTQGTQGITGTQGTQGIQGTTGPQGTIGAQGITGTQGTDGVQGTTGAQGATGAQGTTGSTGVQGATGTQGIQGISGPVTLAAGTLMLFQQTSAPTGWTKQTTHNDKALRVVSGSASSGGTTAFSSVMTSRTPSGSVSVSGSNSGGSVSNTTLSTTEMPSHSHGMQQNNFGGSSPAGGAGTFADTWSGGGFSGVTNLSNMYTTNTGGSGAHGHGFTNPSWSGSASFSGSAMDFSIQYVDLIIASKN